MGLSTDLVSAPHSYWQRSVEHDRALQIRSVDTLPDHCTIAIVGAGLLGISTAYFLARTGANVVVIDRGGIAAGATGRNAGFVVSGPAESYPVAIERYGHTVARAVHQFTIENRELLRTAVAEDAIDCDYREPGYLSLATTHEEWLQHKDIHRTLQADGIPSQLLKRSELQARVAVPLQPHVLGARLAPEEGQIHPTRLLHGLAGSTIGKGVQFAFPYNVTQIARNDNRWTLAVEDGHTRTRIEAEQVLCTTNVWLPNLLPSLQGIITPVRGQVIATAPMPRIFPCGMSADHGLQYWQQLPDGRIMLGGGRMVVADHEVGYTDAHLRLEVQAALDRYLGSLFVGLEQLDIEHRWAGIMGFSRDALPFIGPVPENDGLFVAGGFTGHGMPFGLRAGQALAEALTTGRVPTALAPFRLDRPLT